MTGNAFASNRLADAASPYLRQHADNPVHWQFWDEATLAHAREQDRPILLSIGYSACHWCHVMAHESFEDTAIAEAMNSRFVNIKLDREQRPDIDHVYQLAFQAFQGRGGGWPLTVFLSPHDLAPFFIGTYFPPQSRQGMPGFTDVLPQVAEFFTTHREELSTQATQLQQWLQQVEQPDTEATLDVAAAEDTARQRLQRSHDSQWGGSQGAPKFPRAGELEWLLDARDGSETSAAMARKTLAGMAARGLQDHLGGGFFRYCVDASWTIPHFEKMLYDNAQLLPVYARAAALDDDTAAASAVRGIVAWLQREMTAADGSFCNALDADSEGEEGRFYLWSQDAFHSALGADTAPVAEALFGLDAPANFEGRAWHLVRDQSLPAVAQDNGVTEDEVAETLASATDKLFAARQSRVRPGCDDKRLTAWNALAVSGLARAARMLDDADCDAMAQHALTAIHDHAWRDDRLHANITGTAEHIPGFLDDHAFLLDALLEALQLAFDATHLDWARKLADTLLERFADAEAGGFWLAADEHATPLSRGRQWADASLPSGNGVAASALLRLGHLLGETRYLEAANATLQAGAGMLTSHPEACPALLRAAREYMQPRPQIVVRCPPERASAWRHGIRQQLAGHGYVVGGDRVDVFIITDTQATLPGLLAERTAQSDTDTAWVCAGFTCQAPVDRPEDLKEPLQAALA